jgi:hypothetical protein
MERQLTVTRVSELNEVMICPVKFEGPKRPLRVQHQFCEFDLLSNHHNPVNPCAEQYIVVTPVAAVNENAVAAAVANGTGKTRFVPPFAGTMNTDDAESLIVTIVVVALVFPHWSAVI